MPLWIREWVVIPFSSFRMKFRIKLLGAVDLDDWRGLGLIIIVYDVRYTVVLWDTLILYHQSQQRILTVLSPCHFLVVFWWQMCAHNIYPAAVVRSIYLLYTVPWFAYLPKLYVSWLLGLHFFKNDCCCWW